MSREVLRWSDEVDSVVRGDLTVAAAYPTPAGGAILSSLSPIGLADRESTRLSFTTSLGFPRKLEHILARPRVSLAYHTRDHGFAESDAFVLAQGRATVDLEPDSQRLAGIRQSIELFLGAPPSGPIWDRVLREYHQRRVFVDVDIERLTVWPDLAARGTAQVTGAPDPGTAPAQSPPKNGTAPRVDVPSLQRRIARLGHRLLAYEGADGLPVVVPVEISSFDEGGLHLDVTPGILPPGGRRAGLLAHRFEARCVGLSTRTFTGWLTVGDEGVMYAPHTAKSLSIPPNYSIMMLMNGLGSKIGVRRARRDGTVERLQALAQKV
ncbi:hypothetical protein ACFO4E_08540 [Nocardiopsis mangrovi]|uniref:Pyridoxamine 5'-phosphate oxidase putative domain-containing protein n=1 Tax=Nocardiopsis mangrovi TaxID=1179818 RepID=A0ABV9DSM2_9ACTN